MAAELLAEQDGTVFVPAALDGVTWETHRSGAPGTLTFTALEEDGAPSLREGARVSLRLDGEGLFCGYVFTRARSAGGRVEVTAYDQLRYLRSRDTLLYEGKTASALLRMLAADFRLTLGDVEETGYAIPIGAEENVPVWDMVENALDETYRATGRRYVLYDDFGKLCLKSAGSLAMPLLLDENTVSAYRCEETIDEGAYSRVRLLYEDGRRGVRQLFSGGDESLQERWGVLQYFEKLQDPTGGQSLVESILRAHSAPVTSITVTGAIGSPQVRAGVSLHAELPPASGVFTVESARHIFSGEAHTMNLELRKGGGRGGCAGRKAAGAALRQRGVLLPADGAGGGKAPAHKRVSAHPGEADRSPARGSGGPSAGAGRRAVSAA